MADRRFEELSELREALREFAHDREWEKFHTPKNLAASVCIEAGELLEQFQWLNNGDGTEVSAAAKKLIEAEIADVFIYLIRLADVLDISLIDAANSKLQSNAEKYPADIVRGSSKKYSDY